VPRAATPVALVALVALAGAMPRSHHLAAPLEPSAPRR
jgi:hypothetical protein